MVDGKIRDRAIPVRADCRCFYHSKTEWHRWFANADLDARCAGDLGTVFSWTPPVPQPEFLKNPGRPYRHQHIEKWWRR